MSERLTVEATYPVTSLTVSQVPIGVAAAAEALDENSIVKLNTQAIVTVNVFIMGPLVCAICELAIDYRNAKDTHVRSSDVVHSLSASSRLFAAFVRPTFLGGPHISKNRLGPK